MKSLSRSFTQTQIQKNEIERYVKRILTKKWIDKQGNIRINRRPVELQYLHIAKALNLSYKQVRVRMDELVYAKKVIKYCCWNGENYRKNYYQWNG